MQDMRTILFFLLSLFSFVAESQNKPIHALQIQKIDTVIISSGFKSQFIGANCFHRVGNNFEKYDDTHVEWSEIKRSSYRLSPDSIHWLFAVLKNKSTVDRTLKLYLNNVQAGIVKMYIVSDGKIDSSKITGSLVSIKQRASLDRLLAIPFIIPSGKTIEIYLKSWRRETGITLTLLLNDPSLSEDATYSDYILIIILAFLLLIVIIAITVLGYFSSKETFWFLIYVLFGFGYVLAASGFGSLYIWSAFPWFEENAAIFFGAVSIAGFFEFSRRVLKLRDNYSFINALLICFSIGYPVVSLLGFGLSFNLLPPGVYSSILRLPYLLTLICLIIVLCLSVYKSVAQKKKELWWFVSIFSFYILMAFITILLETGFLKYNYKMHPFLLAFGTLPQMTLTLLFLIKRTLNLLKKGEREIANAQMQGQQKLLGERLRISRELHDDIGSTLGSISIYSEVAKNQSTKNENADEAISKIGVASRELIDKMSDIVWSINPDNESFEQLKNRMQIFAAMMLTPHEIVYNFYIDEAMKSIKLNTEQQKNVYLIYKEAIHNIVKYAECTQVEIKMHFTSNSLILTIRDNGKGFNENILQANESLNGNGIKNMKARAESMNAVFNINSTINNGTSIELKTPV
jgi:signal transduction histidine kinase